MKFNEYFEHRLSSADEKEQRSVAMLHSLDFGPADQLNESGQPKPSPWRDVMQHTHTKHRVG